MAEQLVGSVKKNLSCHNALILQKSKKLTVKGQPNQPTLRGNPSPLLREPSK